MEKIKNYIFFMIYLLFNPKLFKFVPSKTYLPVYIQYEWLKKYDIKTVIDVGANDGKVSKVLNYLFPEATIYAFEPVKENCRIIKKRITSDKIILNNVALSNKKGKTTFYKNFYSPASSMLLLRQKYKDKYKFMSKTKKIKVKTTTLDNYFQNKKIKGKVLLKIDTQGTERLILEGGKNLLSKVAIIHIETSFEELYKYQCLFKDIYDYLTSFGFKYAGEIRESQFYPSFRLQSQVNSIFFNPKLWIPDY